MKSALLAGAVAGVVGITATAPAVAAPSGTDQRQAGLWYADVMKLDEIHSQGITGEGVTIAVIDGGINTQAAELQGADITLKGRWCVDDDGVAPPVDTTDPEISHHGTAVVSTIVGSGVAGDGGVGTRGVAPDAKILFYAAEVSSHSSDWECSTPALPPGVEDSSDYLGLGMSIEEHNETIASAQVEGEPRTYSSTIDGAAFAALDAIRSGADIISVSQSSNGRIAWWEVMAEAVREGVVVVGAAPNAGDATGYRSIPAGLNGAVAVNAIDRDAVPFGGNEEIGMKNMAFGAPGVDVLVPSSSFNGPGLVTGTSFATPMVSGTVALGLQKYPDASGHQVLQAMIRTPGSVGFDEPHWEDSLIGYGLINPKAMLDVDIPQMPDENPLFVTDPNDPRCKRSDGSFPQYVGACTNWAQYPDPHQVWPDEYLSSDEILEQQEQEVAGEEPGESLDPEETEEVATTPGQPADDGINRGLILGVAFIALLAIAGGLIVVVRKK